MFAPSAQELRFAIMTHMSTGTSSGYTRIQRRLYQTAANTFLCALWCQIRRISFPLLHSIMCAAEF